MTPAIRLLKKNNIPFKLHAYQHDNQQNHFGDEAVAKLGLDAHQVYKTLLVTLNGDQKQLAVAITPVATQLDLKKIARTLAIKKTALANPKLAEKITGYLIGGISPLAQKNSLLTLLDKSAIQFASIFISAGQRGLNIELNPNDLCQLLRATLADIAKKEKK